jgi:hypothetical protein
MGAAAEPSPSTLRLSPLLSLTSSSVRDLDVSVVMATATA